MVTECRECTHTTTLLAILPIQRMCSEEPRLSVWKTAGVLKSDMGRTNVWVKDWRMHWCHYFSHEAAYPVLVQVCLSVSTHKTTGGLSECQRTQLCAHKASSQGDSEVRDKVWRMCGHAEYHTWTCVRATCVWLLYIQHIHTRTYVHVHTIVYVYFQLVIICNNHTHMQTVHTNRHTLPHTHILRDSPTCCGEWWLWRMLQQPSGRPPLCSNAASLVDTCKRGRGQSGTDKS